MEVQIIKTKDGKEIAISQESIDMITSLDLIPEELTSKSINGIITLYMRAKISEDLNDKILKARNN